jgi:hypothetical protein
MLPMGEPPEPRPASRDELPITIDLPKGRSLTVRAATLDDLEGMKRLYQELGPADRYRRFFSAFDPDRELIERWVRAPEAGGVRIVAEDETGRIVADGGYARLPNGDAEFDLTVARDRRGWLGPYLLDVLLVHAADHGIPNLEAEVLDENSRMRALIHDRGYAVLGHDGHISLRVIVGTQTDTPTWPRTDRPRLLVEAPSGRWEGEQLARSRGFDVVVCPGPPPSRPERCPALRGGRCPLADEADAVVVTFPTGTGTVGEQLCRAHRTLHEHPVVIREGRGAAPEPGESEVVTEPEQTIPTVMDALGMDPHVLPRRAPREGTDELD